MLEAREITLEVDNGEEFVPLLSDVSFCVPNGHFMAIVGPSGCGKTTLLKAIAGIAEIESGSFIWNGRDLMEEGDFDPNEIGYVPQFSIAHDSLSVDECVENAARLRVCTDADTLADIVERVLDETGLTDIAERRVKLLSGGQKRRLALAMELVSNPRILLCDEVTSGLDPRSEQEIVQLLKSLSQKGGRIVISVTHSLSQLEVYDSIMVLVGGSLAYHGMPQTLPHYFGVKNPQDVYARLALRAPAEWAQSWKKHGGEYYQRMDFEQQARQAAQDEDIILPQDSSTEQQPGFIQQLSVLLRRRFELLFRDKGQLLLQLAMIIIFPLLVTLFSSKGQEQLLILADTQSNDMAMEIQAQQRLTEVRAQVGSAVSGIIMFEVILLGLMGANNAAREIASERLIMEKERFAGMSEGAYLASKAIYLFILLLVQSLWMFAFVQFFWAFRGDATNHLLFLILANAAMTSVCLGISAHSRTPDQASLLSIYLVGFQLPLSGAVLALPDSIAACVRPFISAYWAWSGSIEGGLLPDVIKAVKSIVQTPFSSAHLCFMVLLLHVLVGLVLAYTGVRRSRWD